jgi:hypothetical protein
MRLAQMFEKELGHRSPALAGVSRGVARLGFFLARMNWAALCPTLAGGSYGVAQYFYLLESYIICIWGGPVRGARARRVRGTESCDFQNSWATGPAPANRLVRLSKRGPSCAKIAGPNSRANRATVRQNRRNPAIGGALRSPDRREEAR